MKIPVTLIQKHLLNAIPKLSGEGLPSYDDNNIDYALIPKIYSYFIMIKIDNISKKFFIKNNIVQALENINLLIEEK